jgi:hypothetical protein
MGRERKNRKRASGRKAEKLNIGNLDETIVRAVQKCFDSFGGETGHCFPPGLHKGHTFHLEFHLNFHLGDRTMAEYKNYGQAGAIGKNARSDQNNFVQAAPSEPIDLAELAKQLAQVRVEMKKKANPDDAEQDAEIGAIAQAEKAAKSGDQSKTLEFLKGAGKWTLEVTKSIAAGLVKDAIEGKFGSS